MVSTELICFSRRLLCALIVLLALAIQLQDSLRVLRLNIGLRACPLGKHSQTMRKNFFPRLVFTLISKGGLYHVIFRFLDLWVFLLFFGVNLNLYLYPLLSSAAWYVGAALVNTCSSDEMFGSLWFIFSGIRLMMFGG